MFSFRHVLIRFLPVTIGCVGVLTASNSPVASQLMIHNNCTLVVHVPGIIGSTDLKYGIGGGALYTEDSDGNYCGIATMDTPFGPSPGNECFTVANGQFVSGKHSNKVSSSDCTMTDASVMDASFAPGQTSAYVGTGPAHLAGQAFLKTVVGDVKTCAGENVFLIPGTPYFEELFEKVHAGVNIRMDERAKPLLRQTICDAQGNFSFSALPAKRWLILTQVKWGIPHIEQPGERTGLITGLIFGVHVPPATDEQGGELIQAIDLQAGDNQAFLTSRDQR